MSNRDLPGKRRQLRHYYHEGFYPKQTRIYLALSNSEKDKKCDRETKLKLYSVQRISEYWIADREQQSIEVYRRENGILKKAMSLLKVDRLTSPLWQGFSCEVRFLFVYLNS